MNFSQNKLRGEAREDQRAAEVHRGASAHPGGREGRAGSVPEVGQNEKSSGVHHLQPGAERNSGQAGRGNKLKGKGCWKKKKVKLSEWCFGARVVTRLCLSVITQHQIN